MGWPKKKGKKKKKPTLRKAPEVRDGEGEGFLSILFVPDAS